MRRREFITLASGVAITWPLAARAQQPAPPVVAFIHGGTADGLVPNVAAFSKGLNQTGYAEGQNVTVEYHWLEGRYEQLPALLADVIRRRVAVIATPGGTQLSPAVVASTKTIPIVFGVGDDPVALGLVASLSRPGGNVTGINFFAQEVNAKRLGLMHELLPNARRFAVLVNPTEATNAAATARTLTEAARTLGLDLAFFNADTAGEIDAAFAAFARERPDALFIMSGAFFVGRTVQLVTLAARERLAAGAGTRTMAQAGILMSHGADIVDAFRQVGVYAGSILKGAKPADLPVVQSTKFEFVINLQTAKSLGIDVPPMLLALADEVIW